MVGASADEARDLRNEGTQRRPQLSSAMAPRQRPQRRTREDAAAAVTEVLDLVYPRPSRPRPRTQQQCQHPQPQRQVLAAVAPAGGEAPPTAAIILVGLSEMPLELTPPRKREGNIRNHRTIVPYEETVELFDPLSLYVQQGPL